MSTIEKYEFKKGLPMEFEIVPIEEIFRTNREMLIAPHRTNFYTILWLRKGHPTHVIDFVYEEVKPNSLLSIRKDQVHFFDKDETYMGKAIFFTDKFFCTNESDSKYLLGTTVFNDLFRATNLPLDDSSTPFAEILNLMEQELQTADQAFVPTLLKNYLHNFMLLAEMKRISARKTSVENLQPKTNKPDFDQSSSL